MAIRDKHGHPFHFLTCLPLLCTIQLYNQGGPVIRVAISEFRSHVLSYLNKTKNGQEVVILSRGKEMARLLPPKSSQDQARQKLADLAKSSKIGDIVSPVVQSWDALS